MTCDGQELAFYKVPVPKVDAIFVDIYNIALGILKFGLEYIVSICIYSKYYDRRDMNAMTPKEVAIVRLLLYFCPQSLA